LPPGQPYFFNIDRYRARLPCLITKKTLLLGARIFSLFLTSCVFLVADTSTPVRAMLRYLYIFRNDDLFVRLEFYSHVVHHFSSLRSGSRSPENAEQCLASLVMWLPRGSIARDVIRIIPFDRVGSSLENSTAFLTRERREHS
jgi:hypothetical protein